MDRSFNCPQCGAEVPLANRFARMATCAYCRATSVVTEGVPELSGTSGALAPSRTPFAVGVQGEIEGRSFIVVGRARFRYSQGVWDVWWLEEPDGTTFWVEEDEDRLVLQTDDEASAAGLPAVDALKPGDVLDLPDGRATVREVRTATLEGSEGSLPFVLAPAGQARYADAVLGEDRFYSLHQAGDRTLLLAGRYVDLDAFSFVESSLPEREAPEVAAEAVTCPSCAGALDLKGGEQVRSLVCPYCGSQYDTSQPEWQFVQTHQPDQRPDMLLDLGMTGELHGAPYEVVGYVRYRGECEGERFFLDEVLLYNADKKRYDWLSMDNEAVYIEREAKAQPPEGFLTMMPGRGFRLYDRVFKVVERGKLEVVYVEGEFPYVPKLGDTFGYIDARSGGYQFGASVTGEEVDYTIGKRTTRLDVAQAFGADVHAKASGPFKGVIFESPDDTIEGVVAKRVVPVVIAIVIALVVAASLFSELVDDDNDGFFIFSRGISAGRSFGGGFSGGFGGK